MSKKTDELASEIKHTNDIGEYIRENIGEFNDKMFLRTLRDHYARRDLKQEALADRSMLSHTYVNNILNGAKRPGRDTVIKLAFGLGLTIDETNRLLKLAGHGDLYARLERDAVLLYCLNKGFGIIEANQLLEQQNQAVLASQ